MHFLIDNLIASLIAGSIFLILVGVNHRNQDAAAESVNFYSMRQRQIAFIDMLKRDMQNVSMMESTRENGNDFSFFVTLPGTSDEKRVTYRRVSIPNTDYFRIERYIEDSPGAAVREGQSMETISLWHIRARNASSQPVDDASVATQIYVRFEAGAPFREGRTVKRVRWDAAFRPPMIQPVISL